MAMKKNAAMPIARKAAFSAALALACFGAAAQVSIKDFKSMRSETEFKAYINGVGRGLSWSNADLVQNGQRPTYCAAKNKRFDAEEYLRIIEKTIRENPKLPADTPVELLLLLGLKKAFPCP